jgi:hypothetical protein
VRFDFGVAYSGSGNYYDAHCSYSGYLDKDYQYHNLNGALVNQFDVTGSISGTDAAIYIGDSAHVETINLMSGAVINGDIISDYDDRGNGTTRSTLLTFGKTADANSESTVTADTNFEFTINLRGGHRVLACLTRSSTTLLRSNS